MKRTALNGALVGFSIGFIILSLVFGLAIFCFPYRISFAPAPFICRDPYFGAVSYLAFPANLLTNDLSRVLLFSPLPLLIYAFLGSAVQSRLSKKNRPKEKKVK